jgi:hypothetical protein
MVAGDGLGKLIGFRRFRRFRGFRGLILPA